MEQVYGQSAKVIVDSKAGNNMLYLPLDKIMQLSATPGAAVNPAVNSSNSSEGNNSVPNPAVPLSSPDNRGRDNRQRDRDLR
jgi:membrane protease subunit HflK